MLDIKYLRENKEKIKKATEAKGVDAKFVEKALELDEKRRKLLSEVEELRMKRNEASKKQDRKKGLEVKCKLQKIEPELRKVEEEYKNAMFQIPNPGMDDVKVGKDDGENEVVRKEGKETKFDFEPKDHLELGRKLDIIDTERASKVSGARFTYLKGDAVLLEMALVNFAMEVLVEEGFAPVIPPHLIKEESMQAMGYFEHGGKEDMFVLDKDGLVMIGTSEQAIGPMHAGEILDLKKPLRYAGFSPCYRREAGSYGKDTRGILRLHQFDKVEMFSFCRQEDSEKEHELLLSIEEKLVKKLNIPYQVVKMCTGDLGAPAARKYDLEAWIPSQKKYREITSTSTTTDFQSRRLGIKYKDGGDAKYAHLLNGTAFAIGRMIIAIMENNQQKDGSIKIPEVLQKWMGKKKIVAKK